MALLACGFAARAAPNNKQRDLTELSLEDLLNIEVTSVSRRQQNLSQSASAVYVITAEDIRRSGATTIPDALRLAPGVQVAQIDGNKWAIGIRGLPGRFNNKLLVMIDGRSIYSPIFGGTYWEANDPMLEDIDRIEVIRGPGATMWGSNAVNGVINIITKHSRETSGGLITAGGGDQEGGFGAARFGAEAGPNLHYRFYSKYFSRSGLFLDSGQRAPDNWLSLHGGFRIDWDRSEREQMLLSGDTYQSDGGSRVSVPVYQFPFQQVFPDRPSFSGSNLLGRWTQRQSARSQTQLQVFFDHADRDELYLDHVLDLADVEFQQQLEFSRHRLVWGAGYRLTRDSNIATPWVSFMPPQRTMNRINTFVQDEISLLPGRVVFTVGSKFEKNTFTDLEIQPSVSLLWNRTANDTFWLSASRAVRSPTRGERDTSFDSFAWPGPDDSIIVSNLRGTSAFQSERKQAYETGYRWRVTPRWSFDAAAFYDQYFGLAGLVPGEPFVRQTSPLILVAPLFYTNASARRYYGAELAGYWNPLGRGRLRFSYSWLAGQGDDPGVAFITRGPNHQVGARWYWNLPRNFGWDTGYYFTDHYSNVAAYHRVDSHFSWRPAPLWEFALVLQNLLDNQHREAPLTPFLEQPSEVGRSVYGKLTWRFGAR